MFTESGQFFTSSGGYEIDQSIRFDNVNGVDAGGAQMFRLALTGTPTNTKKATISAWVKRATLGFNQVIAYSGDPNGSTSETLRFDTADTLTFGQASSDYVLTTTQVFRDIGAWYHIVAEIDTANGTSADRANLYVNGTKVTSFSTENYPTQDYVINWTASSSSIAHTWGTNGIPSAGPSSQLFAGYMAEMFVLDGEKAGASSFGETNNDGVWVPIKYSGSFGNNGYYMTGETASALGDDFSGNSLDFTTVALATTDQVKDTPTKNWCVWNPIDTSFNDNTTSDGNLKITTASPGYTRFQLGTFGVTSGKWEWKWTPTASLSDGGIGVDDGTSQAATGASSGAFSSQSANGVIYRSGGTKLVNGSATSYGASFAADDVIRVQLDLDSGTKTIEFFKNDSSQGTINLNNNVTYFPAQFSADAGLVTVADFGQSGFTAAAGFNLLNTSNLSTPTISDGSKYFQATLYSGNGSTQSINQSGNRTFQPDFVWIKNRSATDGHVLTDAVRGVTKILASDATTIETTDADTLTAFESDGFALGDDDKVNTSSENFVAWQWLAGNSSGSTNDDGSVDSTVTVNTTAGFSICKFNPGGNSNVTFGHGLGVAPRLVLVKNLEDATNWQVLHLDQGVGNKLFLNTNATIASDANMWQNTAPTSTVVSVGTAQTSNEQNIAYCFAEVEGFSKFGSYTGNGNANGPFVYTGFAPSFIIFKNISVSYNWDMRDNKRDPLNPNTFYLSPSQIGDAEVTTSDAVDFLSNGFKWRSSGATNNGSGNTIIYMAWAESPFKTATAR